MSEQIEYIPMEEPIFGPHPEELTGPGGAAMLPPPVSFPENFHALPPEGKYQFYKERALGTAERGFASREAAHEYRSRMQRWYDAIELREPDRVPSHIVYSGYMAKHTGVSEAENFYDTPKAARAALQFHEEFQPDYAIIPTAMPGGMYDLLGTRMIRWPGGSRPDSLRDDVSFQYVEGEYMKRYEYSALIQNPEGFLLRTW